MFISLVFSLGIYRISSQELDRSIRPRPGSTSVIFRMKDMNLIQDFVNEQNETAQKAESRLKSNLVLINFLILISGGLLSYYLARKTLQPIEKAHEVQSRFTADASHELRTPITAMRAETELALTDTKLSLAQAKKQLTSNIEELDKLSSLSEGLLRLSQLDNNGIEKSPTKVSDIIHQAVQRVSKKAEQKQQLIVLGKLSDTNISVNQQAIVEAVVTLLDNAIKYSPETTEIKIKTVERKGYINMSIIDKGRGIRASDIPHIFDRFYRADISRTKNDPSSDGYGIGLSIALAAVKAHNGTIAVKSTLDKGATFTISLHT